MHPVLKLHNSDLLYWVMGVPPNFLGPPELKARDLFWSSVVRLSINVCKFFTVSASAPEPLGQFQPKLAQSIQFSFQIKGYAHNNEVVKICWRKFKLFLQNNLASFNQTGHKFYLSERKQIWPNERPHIFQSGDNNEISENTLIKFKDISLQNQ